MEDTSAGRTGAQDLPAGRTGSFGVEFKSAFEALLAGTRIVDQGVVDFGDVFEIAKIEIDIMAVFSERERSGSCRSRCDREGK